MRPSFKYALDHIFLFMLFVSIVLFVLDWLVGIDHSLLKTAEYIDFSILAGYYVFFLDGISVSKRKLEYVKKHWVMLILLLLPFLPLARLIPMSAIQQALKVSSDTLWHFLDELEML